ncbi:ATP-binding protein [Bradyrhizobium sp. USDA 376]
MMELRHLTMVNWHLFDVADIDVRGHVGVLGENRSGKSTILDMAQVVLTGGEPAVLAPERGRRR